MRLGVTIDVPELEAGIAFYAALGFMPGDRPLPIMCSMAAGEARILLMEKPAGSRPFPDAGVTRDYARHWTPVHIDLHVADVAAVRDAALAAGATLEAWHEVPGRPSAAFMADPFGHGFCLIGSR